MRILDVVVPSVALLSVALTACSERDAAQADRSVPRWGLEEEWRLGGVSDTGVQLSEISHSIPAPGGGFSFSQRNVTGIVTLNADRSVRHVVGSSGDGPGEWTGVPRIAWIEDELKVVAGNRVHTFDAEGHHVRTEFVQTVASANLGRTRVLMQLSGGRLVGLARSLHPAAERPVPDVLVHWAPGAEHVDSITSVHGADQVVSVSFGGGGIQTSRPLAFWNRYHMAPDGSGFVAVDPDGGAVDDSASFRVRLFGVDGRLKSDFRVGYEPRHVAPGSWSDTIVARREGLEPRYPGFPAAEIERRLRDAFGPPPTIPPVAGTVISSAGDLWFERGDLREPGVRIWEERDATGLLTGVLQMDGRSRLAAVDGEIAWTIVRGEYDVPIIVRNRLVSGS